MEASCTYVKASRLIMVKNAGEQSSFLILLNKISAKYQLWALRINSSKDGFIGTM